MEESNITANKPIKMADAVRYRDGLMIALLAHLPLRHKNFAAIEIGRDLIKEDDNRFIVIPAEETKTYIEFEIPDERPPGASSKSAFHSHIQSTVTDAADGPKRSRLAAAQASDGRSSS